MASISGSRSGGKMLRTRRAATARTPTPYDRPAPPSQPQSPNWLSRFVFSPTRFIASGAGKLFSSVLDLDSSPTSSSSSDSDSTAEEVGTFDDENDGPFEGDVASNKVLQPSVGNSKNKHIIEQLLMKESFSRDECDRLIKIIRSRVVDPANVGDGDERPTDIPNRTLGNDSPELCSAAVLEAKKWLQEKKSGLDSNSDIGYSSPSLNLVTLPQLPKDDGSPVDVAKTYMRARPPWASPSIDLTKSPTTFGIRHFKEETPHLYGHDSTSSSKLKRDSTATGSWSIQDEIRRVRSRATEEMLTSLPSKIDWSAFATENKNDVNSLPIENIGASLGERVHNSTNSIDASANLAKGLGSRVSPDLESKLDAFQPESLLADPVNFNQGSVAVPQSKGAQDDTQEITTSGLRDGPLDDMNRDGGLVKVNGINDTNESGHRLNSVEETREAVNFRLQDGKHLVVEEKVGAEDALTNGFPSSGTGVYARRVVEHNSNTLDNETNTIDSSQGRTAQGVLEQETCKVLCESMAVVPNMVVEDSGVFKEDYGVASGSQNSSSIQYDIQQKSSQAGPESGLTNTPTSIAKQKGKRVTRYNRRGRSKGVK